MTTPIKPAVISIATSPPTIQRVTSGTHVTSPGGGSTTTRIILRSSANFSPAKTTAAQTNNVPVTPSQAKGVDVQNGGTKEGPSFMSVSEALEAAERIHNAKQPPPTIPAAASTISVISPISSTTNVDQPPLLQVPVGFVAEYSPSALTLEKPMMWPSQQQPTQLQHHQLQQQQQHTSSTTTTTTVMISQTQQVQRAQAQQTGIRGSPVQQALKPAMSQSPHPLQGDVSKVTLQGSVHHNGELKASYDPLEATMANAPTAQQIDGNQALVSAFGIVASPKISGSPKLQQHQQHHQSEQPNQQYQSLQVQQPQVLMTTPPSLPYSAYPNFHISLNVAPSQGFSAMSNYSHLQAQTLDDGGGGAIMGEEPLPHIDTPNDPINFEEQNPLSNLHDSFLATSQTQDSNVPETPMTQGGNDQRAPPPPFPAIYLPQVSGQVTSATTMHQTQQQQQPIIRPAPGQFEKQHHQQFQHQNLLAKTFAEAGVPTVNYPHQHQQHQQHQHPHPQHTTQNKPINNRSSPGSNDPTPLHAPKKLTGGGGGGGGAEVGESAMSPISPSAATSPPVATAATATVTSPMHMQQGQAQEMLYTRPPLPQLYPAEQYTRHHKRTTSADVALQRTLDVGGGAGLGLGANDPGYELDSNDSDLLNIDPHKKNNGGKNNNKQQQKHNQQLVQGHHHQTTAAGHGKPTRRDHAIDMQQIHEYGNHPTFLIGHQNQHGAAVADDSPPGALPLAADQDIGADGMHAKMRRMYPQLQLRERTGGVASGAVADVNTTQQPQQRLSPRNSFGTTFGGGGGNNFGGTGSIVMGGNRPDRMLTNPDGTVMNIHNANLDRQAGGAGTDGQGQGGDEVELDGYNPKDKEDTPSDAATGKSGTNAGTSASLNNFSSNLRWFKYLLLLGGLRQQTSAFYRWYIRVTVWGCTLLCFLNIFFRTKSYRNPLFDVTLCIMHFWVSWSFEKWHVFTKSHHWRLLVGIVSQSRTGNFFVHINQVGVFGLVAVAGAIILIYLGWIGPIMYDTIVAYSNDGHYIFLAIHGIFMTLIIIPWAAACICSSVLFHMVVLAHQSDVEHYFQTVKSLLLNFADSQGSEALEETYGWLVRLHQPVRMRLRMTCAYFNALYGLAIITSLLLIVSGIIDFNDTIVQKNPVWHNVVQDSFYIGLGITAMYGSLWVTSSLTSYWQRFIQRINELPQFLLTHPAAHSGLVNYFRTADVAYTIYGLPVTTSLMVEIITRSAIIIFVSLIIYNWRYFPAASVLTEPHI